MVIPLTCLRLICGAWNATLEKSSIPNGFCPTANIAAASSANTNINGKQASRLMSGNAPGCISLSS